MKKKKVSHIWDLIACCYVCFEVCECVCVFVYAWLLHTQTNVNEFKKDFIRFNAESG